MIRSPGSRVKDALQGAGYAGRAPARSLTRPTHSQNTAAIRGRERIQARPKPGQLAPNKPPLNHLHRRPIRRPRRTRRSPASKVWKPDTHGRGSSSSTVPLSAVTCRARLRRRSTLTSTQLVGVGRTGRRRRRALIEAFELLLGAPSTSAARTWSWPMEAAGATAAWLGTWSGRLFRGARPLLERRRRQRRRRTARSHASGSQGLGPSSMAAVAPARARRGPLCGGAERAGEERQ